MDRTWASVLALVLRAYYLRLVFPIFGCIDFPINDEPFSAQNLGSCLR